MLKTELQEAQDTFYSAIKNRAKIFKAIKALQRAGT